MPVGNPNTEQGFAVTVIVDAGDLIILVCGVSGVHPDHEVIRRRHFDPATDPDAR